MNIVAVNEFRTFDLRECVSRLMRAGFSEEQANAEVDVMLIINEATGATKQETKEIDHRVDMVEVKLDVLSDKFDALDAKVTWGFRAGMGLVAGASSLIIYILLEYLPAIAKIVETHK